MEIPCDLIEIACCFYLFSYFCGDGMRRNRHGHGVIVLAYILVTATMAIATTATTDIPAIGIIAIATMAAMGTVAVTTIITALAATVGHTMTDMTVVDMRAMVQAQTEIPTEVPPSTPEAAGVF